MPNAAAEIEKQYSKKKKKEKKGGGFYIHDNCTVLFFVPHQIK